VTDAPPRKRTLVVAGLMARDSRVLITHSVSKLELFA